jgi:hypothetical protein
MRIDSGESEQQTKGRPDGARPTLEEVAALAGVSTATVSRVLKNSTPVSEGARASVERAVAARDGACSSGSHPGAAGGGKPDYGPVSVLTTWYDAST